MISRILKNKDKLVGISKNLGYSILSSLILTGVLQIIVYPLLAQQVSASDYGLILTTMGIVNTIALSLGNSLNNTRLVQNKEYQVQSVNGDFNVLLLIGCIIGFVIIGIVGLVYLRLSGQIFLFIELLTLLILIKGYLSVEYRMNLNYKMILLYNVASSVGLCIGLFGLKISGIWIIPFLVSEVLGGIFLLKTASLHKEPLKLTPLFKESSSKYLHLAITSFVAAGLVYLDRLILYPVLGGAAVSVYTVSSFFGKSSGLLLAPIVSVMLGYITQRDYKMQFKTFLWINTGFLLSFIAIYGGSIFISPWITGILYPTIIHEALQYMNYANFGSLIGIAATFMDPFVMKYAPTHWLTIIYGVYLISYIALSLSLIYFMGLWGICIAIIVANAIKLLMGYCVGGFYIKKVQGV